MKEEDKAPFLSVWLMEVPDKTGIARSLHGYLCPGVNVASIAAGM